MSKEEKKSKRAVLNKKYRRVFVGVIGTLVFVGLLLFGFTAVYAEKMLPRTHIGGVDVSGLSYKAAEEQVNNQIAKVESIRYVHGKTSWEIGLSDLGIVYDNEATLKTAWSRGKSGSLTDRLLDEISSLFVSRSYPLHYVVDQQKFFATVSQVVGSQVEDEEVETKLVAVAGQPKIILGKKGKRIDYDLLLAQTRSVLNYPSGDQKVLVKVVNSEPRVNQANAQGALVEAEKIIASGLKLTAQDKEFYLEPNLIASWLTSRVEGRSSSQEGPTEYLLVADIDRKKVEAYVSALAGEVDRDPTNARVAMQNGQIKILRTSSAGISVKQKETAELIIRTLLNRARGKTVAELTLVTEERQPEISTESVNSLGIKELIGRAATDFSTSPENRKHNIRTGANALSGIIIKSGEEFSALKYLGKVDASQGYLPELVIRNNKLENQYGGGLCQNATTLFRAIMDAGLPITARQNHSRRVSYYEKPISIAGVNLTFDQKYASIGSSLVGYDATVFVPQPDLKFKNDTGNAVLVQEYTDGNIIYAEIYGTRDGRKPSITKAEILLTKSVPEPIYHDAPNLPQGTNRQLVKGVPGAKTKFTYTVKYPDGRTESQDFVSYYRAIAPEIQVGSVPIVQSEASAP